MPVSLESNDWMVFIDGVQVPYQSIALSYQVGVVSTGSIVLEPDEALSRLRPRSVVAIFCRDRYRVAAAGESALDAVLDGYLYYGGGELVGHQDSKEAHSRGFTITFDSDISVLQYHQGLTVGISSMANYGQIVGTSLISPADILGADTPTDILSVAALGSSFEKKTEGSTSATRSVSGSSDSSEDFALRLIRILSWFMTANGSLRMQAVRSRLLNKICGVPDKVLDKLAASTFAQHMFREVQSQVNTQTPVLGILEALMQQVGYSWATIPLPAYKGAVPGGPEDIPVPSVLESSKRASSPMTRAWLRNDYVVLPNLFYSAPPPCNLIFPDMVMSHTIARTFMREPTRSIITDPFFDLGGKLVFAHIDNLKSVEADDPGTFWASFLDVMSAGRYPAPAEADSAWWSAQPNSASKVRNILLSLTDDELEKGIVTKQHTLDTEYALAFARGLELRTAATGSNQHNVDTLNGIASELENQKGSSKTWKYLRYVQSWLRYQHQLARFNRGASITLRGLRWIAPGFSTAFFDRHGSYLGWVAGITQTITAMGEEVTSVDLMHVRSLVSSTAEAERQITAERQAVDDARERASQELNEFFDTEAEEAVERDLTFRSYFASSDARAQDVYDDIVSYAQSLAESLASGTPTVAGEITARAYSDLIEMAVTILDPEFDIDVYDALPEDVERNVELAGDFTFRFNEAQRQHAEDGLPVQAVGSQRQAAVSGKAEGKALTDRQFEAFSASVEARLDIAIPPEFYNQDFIDLASLDALYVDVLGTKPLYTGPYGDPSRTPDTDKPDPAANHFDMMRTFAKIYEPLAKQTGFPSDPGRSWDSVRRAGDASDSSRWAHETFLKREAQTLRQYLVTHGFKEGIVQVVSNDPSPTIFYRMDPVPSSAPAAAGGYLWDDSVVCRIVDDRVIHSRAVMSVARSYYDEVLAPLDEREYDIVVPSQQDALEVYGEGPDPVATYTMADLGLTKDDAGSYLVVRSSGSPVVTRVPDSYVNHEVDTAPDPLVAARREQASGSPQLTGSYRQRLILAYSVKHFGSRGLAGT